MTETSNNGVGAPQDRIRLVRFAVDKLYDEFDYVIPLDIKSHVA